MGCGAATRGLLPAAAGLLLQQIPLCLILGAVLNVDDLRLRFWGRLLLLLLGSPGHRCWAAARRRAAAQRWRRRRRQRLLLPLLRRQLCLRLPLLLGGRGLAVVAAVICGRGAGGPRLVAL